MIKAVRSGMLRSKQADKILTSMIGYGFYSPVASVEEAL